MSQTNILEKLQMLQQKTTNVTTKKYKSPNNKNVTTKNYKSPNNKNIQLDDIINPWLVQKRFLPCSRLPRAALEV